MIILYKILKLGYLAKISNEALYQISYSWGHRKCKTNGPAIIIIVIILVVYFMFMKKKPGQVEDYEEPEEIEEPEVVEAPPKPKRKKSKSKK